VWLLYAARSKEKGQPYGSPRLWPWWEALASCIAFIAWSAALPKGAFERYEWYDAFGAAIILVLVSGLLPLLGVLFTKKT
jgi:hypothetical protein